jgi:transposase
VLEEENTVKGQLRARAKIRRSVQPLPIIRPKVAGIDLSSGEYWVCGPARADGQPNVRVLGSTTPRLVELADWLADEGVESVAMESTGVYWIPIYEILESRGFEVVLANARQLSHVPGRKTDMQDCQWLQRLHSCGLLRGSFRPGESIRKLRALQRQCANLGEERSRAVLWIQKALDQMKVPVHRAVTDITGQTGMSIVRAMVAGERDPRRLASLRDKRCRKSVEEIAEHLTGTWREEHLFNLKMALQLYDELERMIGTYEAEMMKEMETLQPPERREKQPGAHPNPAKEKALCNRGEQEVRTALWRVTGCDLTHIDGISAGAARVVLTEVGIDLASFPSEKHFVSWLRLSPKTGISGGKPLPKKRNGTGATRVAGVLRMAALSLKNSRTARGGAFRRIARHKGAAVAVFATARQLAILIYRMLRYGQDYADEGIQAYETRFKQRRLRSLKDAARSLGFELVPAAAGS